MTRIVKCAVVGAAAFVIGWTVMGVGLVVIAGNLFRQADLDDDSGAFMPQQALDRFHQRNLYANDNGHWN